MFTIKIEFVHKMHYFKEQCESEERWRAQLPASTVSEPKLQNHAKEENMWNLEPHSKPSGAAGDLI